MKFDLSRASQLLRTGSGRTDAVFRDGQAEAIEHVVQGSGRLLVVQKTGWGKSFVYFIATKLLREQGLGPALLISPLLSLMRNQIAAAKRMGLRALLRTTLTTLPPCCGNRRHCSRRSGHTVDFARAFGE